MAGHFRVVPASLEFASARLAGLAEQLAATDLAGPLEQAARAVPGSDTAGQAGRLSGEAAGSLAALARAVREMSAAHTAAAERYVATDTGNAGALDRLGPGTGGPFP